MTHEEETSNFLPCTDDEIEDDDDLETRGLIDGYDDDEGCYECGGEGWIVGDCDEDCCCCAEPEEEHDVIPCPVCNPGGVA